MPTIYKKSKTRNKDDESQKPVFQVEGKPSFVGPPKDAHEFLRRVKWEAEQLPDVVVANIDPRSFDSQQTNYIPEIQQIPECDAQLLPKDTWETQFAAYFSDLRQALIRYHALSEADGNQTISSTSNHHQAPLEPHPNLPWQPGRSCKFSTLEQFCLGDHAVATSLSDKKHELHPPLLSIVTNLDQINIHKLIKSIHKRLEQCIDLPERDKTQHYSESKGSEIVCSQLPRHYLQWLFSMLALVDKPVPSDVSSTLRSIFRILATCRAQQTCHNNIVVQCNMILAIISHIFEQRVV